MRLYYLILSTIIPLTILLSSLINLTYAQVNETSQIQTYENRDMGIKFLYPSEWGKFDLVTSCDKNTCVIGTTGPGFRLAVLTVSKEACNCNSLMDFVRSQYKISAAREPFFFIGDNQTTVGKKYPGWQYEYSFPESLGENRTALDVLTTNNQTYLNLKLGYLNDSKAILLPQFKNLIDSIEFLPIQNQVAKAPSFMNMSETEESKPNSTIENNPNGLQILSHNSFTDSVGYLHVVGEVQNNTPTNAQFVQVTGTFYDNNNQVVATDFTYTNPSDIGSGQKAPFDLTLISASIPVSQIDHYNLIASYQ